MIAIAEPEEAACIYESVRRNDGAPHPAEGSGVTVMAGLNCAVPCTIGWEILRTYAASAFACDDGVAEAGMARLARPVGEDRPVVSGESGAVTMGLLDRLLTDPALAAEKAALGLSADSVVLLFSTEGDTDPDNYRRVTEGPQTPA